MWRRTGDDPVLGPQRALPVERSPESIEHPAQNSRTDRDAELLLAQMDRRTRPNARQVAERDQSPFKNPTSLGQLTEAHVVPFQRKLWFIPAAQMSLLELAASEGKEPGT